jgi:hypothetical protein
VVSIRINFVHILGDLAQLAAKRVTEPAGPASVLGLLATWLLEVGAKDADLRVVAEALDRTFDAFSEDDTDGVFASQQLLPKLRQGRGGRYCKSRGWERENPNQHVRQRAPYEFTGIFLSSVLTFCSVGIFFLSGMI